MYIYDAFFNEVLLFGNERIVICINSNTISKETMWISQFIRQPAYQGRVKTSPEQQLFTVMDNYSGSSTNNHDFQKLSWGTWLGTTALANLDEFSEIFQIGLPPPPPLKFQLFLGGLYWNRTLSPISAMKTLFVHHLMSHFNRLGAKRCGWFWISAVYHVPAARCHEQILFRKRWKVHWRPKPGWQQASWSRGFYRWTIHSSLKYQ